MSLGCELALAWIAEAGGLPPVIFSRDGLAAPLVDAAMTTRRLAVRPAAGVRLSPYRAYEPPCDVVLAHEDAARIAVNAPLYVDVDAADLEAVRATVFRLRPGPPDVVRLRNASEGPPWPGMRRGFFRTGESDAIWLSGRYEGLVEHNTLDNLANVASDEFDLLRRFAGRERFMGLRHRSGGAELLLSPATALDAPDEGQIQRALSRGVATFDRNGVCALALPTISAGASFGFVVSGAGGDAPRLAKDAPDDWRVEFGQDGDDWRFRITPSVRREGERAEILIDNAPDAVVSDCWIGVRRRRRGWEIWDEADAQLTLEESW